MQPLICKSFAKLNLCLHVLNQRNDGYHNIESIFCIVDLFDTLSFQINNSSVIKLKTNSTEINTYGTAGFIANNSPGSGGYAWRGVNASGTNTSTIDYEGKVTFANTTKIGTFDISSDTASGVYFVPQGLQYIE